jgi:hypothetical protein
MLSWLAFEASTTRAAHTLTHLTTTIPEWYAAGFIIYWGQVSMCFPEQDFASFESGGKGANFACMRSICTLDGLQSGEEEMAFF